MRYQAVPASWAFLSAAGLLVTIAIGCGSAEEVPEATAEVSGSVAVAGKPVRGGAVCFYSLESGDSGKAPLGRNGEFQLDSPLAPGEYTVFLSGVSRIPEKFLSETSSDYTVALESGTNNLTIDLR